MQHQHHNNPPPADLRIHTSLRYDPALVTVPSHNPQISKCWNTDNPSPFLLLDFHRDRLLRAAIHFNWPAAIRVLSGDAGLSLITNLPDHITTRLQEDDDPSGVKAHRLRVSVGADGSTTHEIFDTPPRALESLFPDQLPPPPGDYHDTEDTIASSMVVAPRIPSPPYTVRIDTLSSTPSIYTHFKTTERSVYDDARKRSIPPSTGLTEVLLVSHNSEHRSIMEGSFTTPYFWRQGRWVTPPVSQTPPSALDDNGDNGTVGDDNGGRGCGGHDGVSRRWALERGLAIEQDIPVSSLVDGEECWLSNGAQGFLRGIVQL